MKIKRIKKMKLQKLRRKNQRIKLKNQIRKRKKTRRKLRIPIRLLHFNTAMQKTGYWKCQST